MMTEDGYHHICAVDTCRRPFTTSKWRPERKFCSRPCSYKGRKIGLQPLKSESSIEKSREAWKRKRKFITKTCICGKEFSGHGKKFEARVLCSRKCISQYNSGIFAGEKNPMFGRPAWTKKTHPDVAEKISTAHITNEVNVGSKNGMKKPEAREKARASANRKWASRPDLRENVRQKMLDLWASGAYDDVRVGQCDWHELTLSDGQSIKLQGTWELAYARWMDENGVKFTAHQGRIPYIDDEGVKRSYYPDFCLSDGSFIDVKNPLYEKLHARKLQLIREQNDVIVVVINKQEMERLGLL